MSTIATHHPNHSLLRDYFSLSAWGMFAFSCVVHIIVLFIQQEYVLTNTVYYNTLGEQLTVERIDAFLQTRQKWAWLGYVIIPLTVGLQALLISICLGTGAILLDYKVRFGALFGMVVKALAIFAVGRVLFMLVALFTEVRNLDDLLQADVFSLLGWIGKDGIPDWLLYPLSVVNVFEVLFWLLLAGGMGYLLQRRWLRMIGFVAATYGIGLLLWMLFIVFLQLNLQ